jgi:hypothetical protein
MKFVRALGGSVLWILAGVIGLLGAVASVTIILLPLGIPLLWLARRLFRTAMALMVPRKVRHPVSEAGESVRSGAESARSAIASSAPKRARKARKAMAKAAGRGRSFAKQQTKRFA